MTPYLEWLAQYKELLANEALQDAAKFVTAVITLAFSSITFYLKLRDRHGNLPPLLAWSQTSWDEAKGLPVFPIPSPWEGASPFPFVDANLATRKKGASGWYTVTELRIWNAGGGSIRGTSINHTAAFFVQIEKTLGTYELVGCLSNDPEMYFHLGRPLHGTSAERERIPIYFNLMPPEKGLLISVRHNAARGDFLRIIGSSDQAAALTYGIHNVFRNPVVKFMDRLTLFLLIPSAIFSAMMFYVGYSWVGATGAFVTWTFIWSIYSKKKFKFAPHTLTWSNQSAKVL